MRLLCTWMLLLLPLQAQDATERPAGQVPAVSHQDAAELLADRIAELESGDAKADAAALKLLALAHLSQVSAGPVSEGLARRLGLTLKTGVAGSAEGHAIHDLQYWIRWGDYDLAETAYRVQYREIATPLLRFVRAWGLLNWAATRKRGYDRALSALEDIKPQDAALRNHVQALIQSLRGVWPCSSCEGKGRIRCTQCHGKGCDACDEGESKCPSCKGPRPAPQLKDVCASIGCDLCEGRGLLFKSIRWTCPECRGLGVKLTPKADPEKRLP